MNEMLAVAGVVGLTAICLLLFILAQIAADSHTSLEKLVNEIARLRNTTPRKECQDVPVEQRRKEAKPYSERGKA